MKAFCIDGLRYYMSIMYFDPLSFRMEVKIFPTHDIKSGLKLDGN